MGDVAARKIAFESWTLEEGAVGAGEPPGLRVLLASGRTCRAVHAASCLLEPAEGDRVLVAWLGDEAFVVSVLTRAGRGPARLSMGGDAELRVEGTLSLEARDRIVARAPNVSIAARSWLVRAADAVLSTDRLSLSSARALLDLRAVEAVLGAVETVAERLVTRAGRSLRQVDDVDQVRAGRVEVASESTLSLHAHDTLVTADGLVKMDAEQIQLG